MLVCLLGSEEDWTPPFNIPFFIGRCPFEEIVLSGPDGDRVFVLRHVIEFNAERKRMSVLCEHNGAVWLD